MLVITIKTLIAYCLASFEESDGSTRRKKHIGSVKRDDCNKNIAENKNPLAKHYFGHFYGSRALSAFEVRCRVLPRSTPSYKLLVYYNFRFTQITSITVLEARASQG
jgi:hypothetical protein